MVDDEAILQEEEVTGDEVATCELCGRPQRRSRLVALGGRPEGGDPVEALWVCETCLLAIERDEVPFEAEIGAALRDAEP